MVKAMIFLPFWPFFDMICLHALARCARWCYDSFTATRKGERSCCTLRSWKTTPRTTSDGVDVSTLSAVERYARENGEQFRTSVFSDGDEILEGYAANYDIILLDIQMRRMDGMRAAERIRELDTDVILIFVTQMVNFAVRGYAVNAMDFLVKPISYPSLVPPSGGAAQKAHAVYRRTHGQGPFAPGRGKDPLF